MPTSRCTLAWQGHEYAGNSLMCGIAGIFLKNGKAQQRDLETMASTLQHRGPDANGFFRHNGAGLAHTRLSIIDLAGGDQPLFNEDRTLAVVANGEIYNYIELREELEKKGHQFSTGSDCETIVHAYAEWGLEFSRHLYGMFSFALYDCRREKLILVRDRLGIKPLYIQVDNEGLRFASEIKALLPLSDRLPELRPDALVEFLQNNFISGSHTMFESIDRVAPGECVEIEEGRVTRRSLYWSLLEVRGSEMDQKEAERAFDDLMETVVRQHMRSDVPFGVFLSGGVDSSILVALVRRYSDKPLHTWSVGFPDSSVNNELSAAEAIAKRFSTTHSVLELERDELLAVVPETIGALDEWMGDNANMPTWLLAREAAKKLKVVFSGEGGDEVFAGYGRYRMPAPKRWLRKLASPGTGGFRARGMLRGNLGRTLLNEQFRHLISRGREPFVAAWQACPREWSDLQRMQYTDITTWLCDDLLVKVDRMLMAHSLEGRVPFLDHRIVEFGLALPDALKIDRRNGKLFLKHWAGKFLPSERLWSRKRGFSVPVRDWMRGPLLDELEVSLADSQIIKRYLDPAGIERLLSAQRRGAKVHGVLWALYQLITWEKIYART